MQRPMIALLLLMPIIAFSQDLTIQPPAGLEWGMKIDSIKAIFNEALTLTQNPDQIPFPKEMFEEYAFYISEDTALIDSLFPTGENFAFKHALLAFSKETRGLAMVDVSISRMDEARTNQLAKFDEPLKNRLVQKYGKGKADSTFSKSITWVDDDGNVLLYISLDITNHLFVKLGLRYKQAAFSRAEDIYRKEKQSRSDKNN